MVPPYARQLKAVQRKGESYTDILTELEQTNKTDTKLILYGDAYRCPQLPIHLLSCDDTGAVQLQIMSVPDYRHRQPDSSNLGMVEFTIDGVCGER